MSDTSETSDKAKPSAGGKSAGADGARKTLTLTRTVEQGTVRQSFSQGRSKAVQVEVKKTRKLAKPGEKLPGETGGSGSGGTGTTGPASSVSDDQQRLGSLSNNEMDKRMKALEASREREEADARERAEEAARRAAEAAAAAKLRGVEAPEVVAPVAASVAPVVTAPTEVVATGGGVAKAPASEVKAPTDVARPAPSTARADVRPGQPTARPGVGAGATAARPVLRGGVAVTPDASGVPGSKRIEPARRVGRPENQVEDDDVHVKKKGGIKILVKAPVKTPEEKKERVKLTINNAFDDQQRERSLASLKRKRERERLKAMGGAQAREKILREVILPEAITIQELAHRMSERSVDVIKLLMKQGVMHKINDVIDADTAELIVTEFGHTVKRVSESDVEEGFIGDKDIDDHLLPRAPVVTIMGHVDHGKTSLLDAIRQTNVVSGEAGGITQHIGAYQVTAPDGHKITFIDTPGHEAFTAMRARGAKVTDIVVLVVAADDGVMPQTIEAINHAKAAGVPMIVAINKIDKGQADPNRVRTELLQHEIVVESMSGETLEVPVSALKRTGIDKLLEAIALQSEILQLKANFERSAEGYVIEAKLERGRGPVGTVLVQRGTLRVGDIVVAGSTWGRVRALLDDRGEPVKDAGPSVPVEILGFDSAPEAGDQMAVVESEARAREITDYRIRKRRETLGSAGSPRTLEQMMQQLKEDGKKEMPLVVKADVQGSVEAIAGSLAKVGNEEVGARIVHSGVGQITESDVALAVASKAIIFGFNVRANTQAKQMADSHGIEIRYYSIIYDLVDEVKLALSGMLTPTRKENFLGYATIKQVFNITKVGKIAGCVVTEGKVERGAKVRLLRERVVIHEGTLSMLKRFKDDAKEVPSGQECGMAFANYQDLREGDEIECYQVEIIQRSL
ncbi:MAG: translation initiation factor IF-2 [Hyphomicrobiaceae bacterium]|nr:translation initiation factor IF-2 [Hyphomicrobiaceae bacterium]